MGLVSQMQVLKVGVPGVGFEPSAPQGDALGFELQGWLLQGWGLW